VASKDRSLREAGAREVHLLASCPPICFSCDYGIHFPTSDKLLARGNPSIRFVMNSGWTHPALPEPGKTAQGSRGREKLLLHSLLGFQQPTEARHENGLTI